MSLDAPTVLFEDAFLLAVNKPAGQLVHKSRCVEDRVTTADTVRRYLGHSVFAVHRLDRPTSGVLVFAKDRDTAAVMGAVVREHRLTKKYLALVRGRLPESLDIDHPVHVEGSEYPAQTSVQPIGELEISRPVGKYASAIYTWVRMIPRTGRQHQLRQHMKHLSHPIIGDTTYGDGRHNRLFRELGYSHLWLHAESLEFDHPKTQQALKIQAPVPHHWMARTSDLNYPGFGP